MNRAAASAVRITLANRRDRWLLLHQRHSFPTAEVFMMRRCHHSICRSTLPQLVNLQSTSFTSDSIAHQSSALLGFGPVHKRWSSHLIRLPAIASSKRQFHKTIFRSEEDDDDASKSAKAPPKDTAAAKPEGGKETKAPPKSPKKEEAKPSKGEPSDPTEAAKAPDGMRKVNLEEISPKLEGGPPMVDGKRQYTSPELTKDAAFHKAGLEDPTRPLWQNPLHHNNPDFQPKFFREDFDSEGEFQAAIQPAPPLDHPDGTPSYPQYLHDLADDMVHLTMLEMNELLNYMADHYGFHEGILSPEGGGEDDGGGDDGDADAPPPEAEKTAFDVKLASFDAAAKIKIIKEVRVVVPGLGLKEAKEMVEGAPVLLQTKVSKEVAEQTKAKLEALGAVIEIV